MKFSFFKKRQEREKNRKITSENSLNYFRLHAGVGNCIINYTILFNNIKKCIKNNTIQMIAKKH
jgi:hypothetical protein